MAPLAELELGDVKVTPAVDAPSERPVPIGWLFAGVALVALVVEAWAYHRRW